MSQSQFAVPAHRRTNPGEPTELTDEDAVQAVLAALDDPDCRAILEAASDESLTAAEIGEACDLPSSTAYRKIDVLDEAGLLDEELRIRRSGKHVSEYTCGVEDVSVSFDGDGVQLSVTHCERENDAGLSAAFAD
ncbi:winged helix-turn-helix domain-containing protein [Halobacterium wangiae]|uniref:winged helix-turn-helix domain-containing protein n=1 Tax=Halobacterium wangiae TaxID=2902623 RepID=UPI001E5DC08A|nr:helix-turn-helix domain-containing protein [Halobacterium wangiae]